MQRMCTNQSDSAVTHHHDHIVSKIICQLLAPSENGLSLFYLNTTSGIFIANTSEQYKQSLDVCLF